MTNVIKFGYDFIELVFNAQWHYVQALWDFIKALLSIFLRDSIRSDMITMAIIELVENAVKYSRKDESGLSEIRFRLNMDRELKRINVVVSNPSDPDNVKVLYRELERIQEAEDPKIFFREKMREVALRDDDVSQLGLVRIIVEAGANLDITEIDNMISVKADFPLQEAY